MAGILGVLFAMVVLIRRSMPFSLTTSLVQKVQVAVKPTLSALPSLAIEHMRTKSYPGSPLAIEQVLPPGPQYKRFIVSYVSDGLTLRGLLTVPDGQKPQGGWPVILLNHGYIPPREYSTTVSYENIVSFFASNGYIVFMPDYRGNGQSPGTPEQPYISPAYVTDSLNALASIRKYKDANPNKIGVFGHSMGGNITLHELVLTHDFKAAVIWAGAVGSYSGLVSWWNERYANHSIIGNDLATYTKLQQMLKDHGTPQANPVYWDALDPTGFIRSVSAPVLLQVGTMDEEVPVSFTYHLDTSLQRAGKNVKLIVYPGADHNLDPLQQKALADTIAFFDTYVK